MVIAKKMWNPDLISKDICSNQFIIYFDLQFSISIRYHLGRISSSSNKNCGQVEQNDSVESIDSHGRPVLLCHLIRSSFTKLISSSHPCKKSAQKQPTKRNASSYSKPPWFKS